MIVGIGGVHVLHCVGVGFGAGLVIGLFRVIVKGGDGGDVGLLAGSGFIGQLPGGVCLFQTAGDDFGVGLVPELMPDAHGDAPMRHPTLGIILGDLHEFFLGFFVPEGVQERDS